MLFLVSGIATVVLPFAYDSVRGLSTEARQVLERHRPATVGQAARIPGITPTAVSLLLVHVKKRSLGAAA